jgi:hypothetical protein
MLLGPQIEGGKTKGDDVTVQQQQHHDEVETVTLLRGVPVLPAHDHDHDHDHVHTTNPNDAHDHDHDDHGHPPSHQEEPKATHPPPLLDEPTLTAALSQLPKESVYRVKGFIRFPSPSLPTTPAAAADESWRWRILNWAFGRWEFVRASAPASPGADENEDDDDRGIIRLTVMGERGEVLRYAERLAKALGAAVVKRT